MNLTARWMFALGLLVGPLWLAACAMPLAPVAVAPAGTAVAAQPAPPAAEPAAPAVVWRSATEGAIWGTPAFHGDTVYVGSDDGQLYAIAAATGERRWAFVTGGVVRSRPSFDTAAGRTLVFFASDDGYAYALDAQSGTEVWRADIGNLTERSVREKSIGGSTSPLGYDYVQSSPVVAAGRVYIGSADGKVYALRADSGDVVWTFQTDEKVRATPTVADGTVYVGSWDKTMVALDAATGELRWRTPIGGEVQTTALVDGGLVFSASRKASVVALDAQTGAQVWEFSYGRNMWVESSPTLVGSTLYIGSSGNQIIYGLDARTGELRLFHMEGAFCWSTPLLLAEGSTMAIGCTNVQSGDQGLMVLRIGPHERNEKMLGLTEVWRLPMGESQAISRQWQGAASSPILADGVIYIGGLDGVLYAVRVE